MVNPANSAIRGGGGADGAIHRAGGPAILRDCVERFPNGLATGDADWTTAGDLPAGWAIHTVGPNYSTGQTDRSLLESCYRRAVEVAAELRLRNPHHECAIRPNLKRFDAPGLAHRPIPR